MINRETYQAEITKMSEIAQRYEAESFVHSSQRLEHLKDNFDVKVMVVGHFSAGKSALLNCLIGRNNFLAEQQSPQTAIATELHYSEMEKYIGVDKNGEADELNKNALDKLNAQSGYTHAELYLDAPALKEISDFTIVDTPGFDSGIETHNKALTAYLGYGSAYILIIDAEKGGIDKVSLRFLNEISQYSSHVAVIINKCDKQIEENIQRIKEATEETLSDYGYDCPVYCMSKYDEDVSDKLIQIIQNFDAQQLYDAQMRIKIRTEAENAVNVLKIIKRKMNFSTYDVDVEIHKYERAKTELTDSFRARREKAKNTADQLTQNIMNQIRAALLGKADAVANAALGGGTAGMQAIVVETIRPIIVNSLKEFAIDELDSIAHDVDLSDLLGEEEAQNLSDIIRNLTADARKMIDSGFFGKIEEAIKNEDEGEGKEKDGKTIYQLITGILAIFTDVLAPVLEALIVFLPDIVKLFQSLFGESKKDKIKRTFQDSVVPQITERLYQPVEQAVQQSHQMLIDNLQQAINENLNSINKLLDDTKAKKSSMQEEYINYMSKIDEDIAALENISDGKEFAQ